MNLFPFNLKFILTSGIGLCLMFPVIAQTEIVEPIEYGDMDRWMVREVKESFIIGGNTKYLYELTTGDTLKNNTPYKNTDSPWGTSSVMARVSGVVKTSITVFRNPGEKDIVPVWKPAWNIVKYWDYSIFASLPAEPFFRRMVEPITDTKNPQSKLISGIPFTKRPKALTYDYKVVTGGLRTYASGFGKPEPRTDRDMAETCLLLQHRWEDAEGNVYAKRVGTAWECFDQSVTEWQNGHRLPIYYGDISNEPFYKSYMGLINGKDAYYTRNSQGKMVPIQEIGWAAPQEEVTHIVLRISSSNGGAYIGSIDSKFWVDNVGLIYEKEN